MEVTKFNTNSISTAKLPEVSYLHDGLMTAEDKQNLESVRDMTGKNIVQVTVTGYDYSELKSDFDSLGSKVTENDNSLRSIDAMTQSFNYCGRVWDETSSSPTAQSYCGNLDMLRNLPELLGLGCYLVQNDHTRRKLDPNDHYKFADDGSEANLDGSMGHYQWGWNREFYITTWTEGNLFYETVSFMPLPGRESYKIPVGSMSACGFAAIDRETGTLVSYVNDSPRYRGGNNNAIYDTDIDKTLLGRPVSFMSIEEFIPLARKNGTGWFAGSMRMLCVVKVLFDIIMGTHNCQAEYNSQKDSNGLYQGGLGIGVSYIFDTVSTLWKNYNDMNPFIHLSTGIELGDYSGLVKKDITFVLSDNITTKTVSYDVPVFFGLKNPYGQLWRLLEDEFGIPESTEPYNLVHYARQLLFSDDYVFGETDKCLKLTMPDTIGSWYIQTLSYKNLEVFPAIKGNASNSTYQCEFYRYNNIQANTNLRVILRGGDALRGYYSGIVTVDAGGGRTYKINSTGTSLVEFTEEFPIEPIIS